jgi:hypothetical protein
MLSGFPPHIEEALREYVWRWFSLLAAGKTAEALALIDAPNSYGNTWSRASLSQAIQDCNASAITEPRAASGNPQSSLVAFADGSGFSYYHGVPLDGAWSDLEVQFEFLKQPSGYAAVLHDVHVP